MTLTAADRAYLDRLSPLDACIYLVEQRGWIDRDIYASDLSPAIKEAMAEAQALWSQVNNEHAMDI